MSSLCRLTVVLLVAIPGCASLIGADFERPAAREGETDGATPSGVEGGADGGDCALTCGPPPANACIDATTLRAYVSRGTCVGKDACGYAHYDVLCANGCKGGVCMGNEPCNGVTCIEPPAPACLDGKKLRTHSSSGTCSGGTCSYAKTDTTCASGCANNACTGEPCVGISCSEPPASSCLNANTRRGYEAAGTCSAGACSYAPVDTPCANGCEAGACLGNPCAGVTCEAPPAAACLNATTRRSYGSPGTCRAGTCSYAATDTACTAPANADPVCTSGACGFTCREGYVPSGASCVADDAIGDDSRVSAGGWHTCGVKTDGSVACWGNDGSGQSSAPGGSFRQVSAGGYHTCGVKTDGSVGCWGQNGFGQSSAPGGSFRQISAGGWHTCAVKTDGSVACWGSNGSGRSSAPGGSFRQVSAGGLHTCGVKTDGSVACWGANSDGRSTAPGGTFWP